MKRSSLEAYWRGHTDHSLQTQLKRNVPLKRPGKVKLFARPDWMLATNGTKTALINTTTLKLSWLDASKSAVTEHTNYSKANPLASKRLKLTFQADNEVDDDASLVNMCVRSIELTDTYAAIKVRALQGGYGRLRVWRVKNQQLVIDQPCWSFDDHMEIRGRWLHYAEDLSPYGQLGRDRLVVLDLEATTPSTRIHRLNSPVSGMEAHLHTVTTTEAQLFHNYYQGRTHHWCLILVSTEEEDKVLHCMSLPPTKIYPGHATCVRVEHNNDQVLVYGRGYHRYGFTTWLSILQLSDNQLIWETNVGFTPSTEGMDIVQVNGDGICGCHHLIWPYGQQSVKILSMDNGNILYSVSLNDKSIIAMLGQPIVGSLVLLALTNSGNNTDQCLMLDAQNGQLMKGPALNHVSLNRRMSFAATTTHLLRWDGKSLELLGFLNKLVN